MKKIAICQMVPTNCKKTKTKFYNQVGYFLDLVSKFNNQYKIHQFAKLLFD